MLIDACDPMLCLIRVFRHPKGRRGTGVRFDKGTKESDVTFDTYWYNDFDIILDRFS